MVLAKERIAPNGIVLPAVEMDDEAYEKLSAEGKRIAKCLAEHGHEPCFAAWERGLTVRIESDGKIYDVAPDGTMTYVKESEPYWTVSSSEK